MGSVLFHWGKEGLDFVFQLFNRRNLLIVAGILVCAYAISVLIYVQTIPDLGVKSAFDTSIKGEPRLLVKEGKPVPRQGDEIIKIGNKKIESWPDLLKVPFDFQKELTALMQKDPTAIKTIYPEDIPAELRNHPVNDANPFSWALRVQDGNHDYFLVHAQFLRFKENQPDGLLLEAWCVLDRLPAAELFPAILWFILKLLLFVVGALVLWKRPNDPASVQFFILCLVTLGAYMGGYHWPHLASQPLLIIGFIIPAVLVPAVTLHFYLVFPRSKTLLTTHRSWAMLLLYGVPVLFLGIIIFQYWNFRDLYQSGLASAELLQSTGRVLVGTIHVYLGVAAVWYLLSVAALLHSFGWAANLTERNQVKCILLGAVAAVFPIGYSLYLALFEPDRFGAGGATWPMFAASLFITAAFIVSITRYRLMELDQIISSGAVYFLISFLVGLGYYGVVFLGTLVFNQVLAGPPLYEALWVSTIALVLLVMLDLARTRLRKALDRRFHREKYHLDRTLHRMSEAVQQLVDPPTLVQRLLYASADLLGVQRGAVYLHHGEPVSYRLAGWVGPAPASPQLPHGPLAEALTEGGVVSLMPRIGPARADAREQLRQLGGEVAHALVKDGRLLAFLVLGPKANGLYRPEDLNLLAAFAQITVLALGNAERHQTIEVLNDDLQAKVEKIAEQQRRILALQSQLRRQGILKFPARGFLSGTDREELAAAAGQKEFGKEKADSFSDPWEKDWPFAGKIVGSSPKLGQLLQMIRKVSRTDAVVLIRGESGTGKELLAEAVHQASSRADKAFVKVHCAALSPTLLESELFGHVKGAFTGAHRDKVGRFELANGGTLFLDEIGDISLEVQTKLLRVLQEKTIERVGSSESLKVDVRIIAATHQDLEALIRHGRFREDLYYRLNVFPIIVPPLRQRQEDIAELALHFLQQAAKRCGKPALTIDDDALMLLKSYPWPGNIRQLENVIERAVVLVEGTIITAKDLPEELDHAIHAEGFTSESWTDGVLGADFGHDALPLGRTERDQFERDQLLRALQAAGGNKAQAARRLGIARSTLVSRLKKFGML